MRILSIETSCDDTGISILEAKGGTTNSFFKVLADNVSSQISVHIPYGGVFPALAKREHIKNLPFVLEKTLKEARLNESDPKIDLIAVTSGPGLEPALWTGIVFAKELSKKWKIPVIPVNHMEGHVVSVYGTKKGTFKVSKNKNPTLALLVSGGHTELVLVKKPLQYEIIGQTVDDAVGEAFDKVARMLGLPYPGGPEISKMAETERGKENRIFGASAGRRPEDRVNFSAEKLRPKKFSFSLPRPMLHSKNFDFSYSGLKTAVLYMVRDLGGVEKLSNEVKSKIALEFENAAIECLTYKTKKAIEKYKIKTLIVAGGVSANKHLQNEIKKVTGHAKGRASKKIKLLIPKRELTGDKALMIGISGYLNFIKNKKKVPRLSSIKADGNLRLK